MNLRIPRLELVAAHIDEKNWEPTPSAPNFISRPRRDAAVATDLLVQQHAQLDKLCNSHQYFTFIAGRHYMGGVLGTDPTDKECQHLSMYYLVEIILGI